MRTGGGECCRERYARNLANSIIETTPMATYSLLFAYPTSVLDPEHYQSPEAGLGTWRLNRALAGP